MMHLASLAFRHVGPFRDSRWDLAAGVTTIPVPDRKAALLLREALGNLLGIAVVPERDWAGRRAGISSVRAVLRSADEEIVLSKAWRLKKRVAWTAEGRGWLCDMTTAGGRTDWARRFLTAVDGAARSFDQAGRQYVITNRVMMSPAAELLPYAIRNRFVLDGLGDRSWGMVWDRLAGMVSLSLDQVARVKMRDQERRQRALRVESQHGEVQRIEAEVADLERTADHLEDERDRTVRDRGQLEKIHLYVLERRSEQKALEVERQTYEAILQNQGSPTLDEDEVRDLEAKARRYEVLTGQIRQLEEKLVEKRHLEKNRDGLRAEIADLKPEASKPGVDKKIKVYQAEIRRITKTLRHYEDMGDEIVRMQQERSPYDESYHRFMVVKRAARNLSPKDLKQVTEQLEKVQQSLGKVQEELRTMAADENEMRLGRLAGREEVLKQQALEVSRKIDDLKRRKVALVTTAVPPEPDAEGETVPVVQPFSVRRHFGVAEEALGFLEKEAWRNWLAKVTGEATGGAWTDPDAKQVLPAVRYLLDMNHGLEEKAAALERMSESEQIRVATWLRLTLIERRKCVPWIFLDDVSETWPTPAVRRWIGRMVEGVRTPVLVIQPAEAGRIGRQ